MSTKKINMLFNYEDNYFVQGILALLEIDEGTVTINISKQLSGALLGEADLIVLRGGGALFNLYCQRLVSLGHFTSVICVPDVISVVRNTNAHLADNAIYIKPDEPVEVIRKKLKDVYSNSVSGNYNNPSYHFRTSCLSVQQYEIMKYIAKGNSIRDIAARLNLRVKYIYYQRSRIKDILFIKNNIEMNKLLLDVNLWEYDNNEW